MPRKILMEHLADVVNEIQDAHRGANPGRKIKLIEIAYWSDASQSKISRFESGKSQPRDIDQIVVAYAALFGTTPSRIMREATDRWISEWGAAKPPSRLPGGLLPEGGAIETLAQESERDDVAQSPRESRRPKRRRDNG